MHIQYSARPAPPPRRRRKKASFLGSLLRLFVVAWLAGAAGLLTGISLPEPAADSIRATVARVNLLVRERTQAPSEDDSPFVVKTAALNATPAATPLIVAEAPLTPPVRAKAPAHPKPARRRN